MSSQSLEPYCRLCWFPSSKPNFALSANGVCRACEAEVARVSLPDDVWAARAEQFSQLIESAVAQDAPNFDLVVPVSGGKDSITQVVRASQHGARILAICVDYGVKTAIGRHNLDVVPSIGERVHLQVYRPPLQTHRKLILRGLRDFGDPDLFSHTLLHAYPLHQALALQVPLVVLGENSADVYGGTSDIAHLSGMTRSWFETYAVSGRNNVMTTADEIGVDRNLLRYYDFPDAIENSTTKTVFLSSYYRWDSEQHFQIASQQGFKSLDSAREGTFKTYVGIDEHINRIHQYLKLLKFGYGRATDHVCEEIRLGRISREEGRDLILAHELLPPSAAAISAVSDFLGITPNKLASEMEAWRNLELWESLQDGRYRLPNFLNLGAGPRVMDLRLLFPA